MLGSRWCKGFFLGGGGRKKRVPMAGLRQVMFVVVCGFGLVVMSTMVGSHVGSDHIMGSRLWDWP